MTAVATTDHQLTLQALRHAQNLAELQGIKQRHGEKAVRWAWNQLSDRERHALKAIADGHQLKHQNQLQQSAAEPPQQERQAEPATAQQERAQSAQSERQPQDSLWSKSAEVAELEKQLEDVALDDSLSDTERDERQAEVFEQWLAADKENQAQRLKRYMLQALQKRGQQRVRGTFATVFQQRRSQIRPNCTAGELPEHFQRVTVEPRQSELSQAYKQAQQQGQDFPWAYETAETVLTIRFK